MDALQLSSPRSGHCPRARGSPGLSSKRLCPQNVLGPRQHGLDLVVATPMPRPPAHSTRPWPERPSPGGQGQDCCAHPAPAPAPQRSDAGVPRLCTQLPMSRPCQASHRPGQGGPQTPRPHLPPSPSPTGPPSGLRQQQEPGQPPGSERQERPGRVQAPWPRLLTTPLHPLSVWWTSPVPTALPGGQVLLAPHMRPTDTSEPLQPLPRSPPTPEVPLGCRRRAHLSQLGGSCSRPRAPGPQPPQPTAHPRPRPRHPGAERKEAAEQQRAPPGMRNRTGPGPTPPPPRRGGPGAAAPPGALPLTRTRGDQRHAAGGQEWT